MKHLSIIARFGIYSALGITAFFALVYYLGFGDVSELRLFNLIIVVYFTNRLIQKNTSTSNEVNYLENLGSAFLSNLICVLLCLIALIVFVNFVEVGYLENINNDSIWAQVNSLNDMLLVLFLEGMSSAAIISFSLMQYWKNESRAHKTLYETSA